MRDPSEVSTPLQCRNLFKSQNLAVNILGTFNSRVFRLVSRLVSNSGFISENCMRTGFRHLPEFESTCLFLNRGALWCEGHFLRGLAPVPIGRVAASITRGYKY